MTYFIIDLINTTSVLSHITKMDPVLCRTLTSLVFKSIFSFRTTEKDMLQICKLQKLLCLEMLQVVTGQTYVAM